MLEKATDDVGGKSEVGGEGIVWVEAADEELGSGLMIGEDERWRRAILVEFLGFFLTIKNQKTYKSKEDGEEHGGARVRVW